MSDIVFLHIYYCCCVQRKTERASESVCVCVRICLSLSLSPPLLLILTHDAQDRWQPEETVSQRPACEVKRAKMEASSLHARNKTKNEIRSLHLVVVIGQESNEAVLFVLLKHFITKQFQQQNLGAFPFSSFYLKREA